MMVRNVACSVCLERMSRHWTRGSPALIIVANWRVKIARSRVLTTGPNWGMLGLISPRFLRTEVRMLRFFGGVERALLLGVCVYYVLVMDAVRIRPLRS